MEDGAMEAAGERIVLSPLPPVKSDDWDIMPPSARDARTWQAPRRGSQSARGPRRHTGPRTQSPRAPQSPARPHTGRPLRRRGQLSTPSQTATPRRAAVRVGGPGGGHNHGGQRRGPAPADAVDLIPPLSDAPVRHSAWLRMRAQAHADADTALGSADAPTNVDGAGGGKELTDSGSYNVDSDAVTVRRDTRNEASVSDGEPRFVGTPEPVDTGASGAGSGGWATTGAASPANRYDALAGATPVQGGSTGDGEATAGSLQRESLPHKRRRRRRVRKRGHHASSPRRRRSRVRHAGPKPHLDAGTWRRLRARKQTPGPGSYSPIVARTGVRVHTLLAAANKGAFFGSSSRPWQESSATPVPGPGTYEVRASGLGPQCESDKANGASVGFPMAGRTAEARRFISAQHSRHHKPVRRNEPGPGQYNLAASVLVAEKASPAVSFGSETRDQRRLLFVSHDHNAIDYQGRFSPGPATYGTVSTFGVAPRQPHRPNYGLAGGNSRSSSTSRKPRRKNRRAGTGASYEGRGDLSELGKASPGPIYFPTGGALRQQTAVSIGRGPRRALRADTDVPGPGMYSPRSQAKPVRAHHFDVSRRLK